MTLLASSRLMLWYITIIIAHGHADISMIQHIRKNYLILLAIAGNVGTPEAVREVENASADATKGWRSVLVGFAPR